MSQVRLRHPDNQTQYVPKRLVLSLIERLRAEWVIYGVLARMLPEAKGLDRLRYYAQTKEVGATMLAAAELPGLSFMLRGKRQWGGSLTRDWLEQANG